MSELDELRAACAAAVASGDADEAYATGVAYGQALGETKAALDKAPIYWQVPVPDTRDVEVMVIGAVAWILDQLPPGEDGRGARARILAWMQDRYSR